MTQTVLVTGGAGFIGSNLARLLRLERPDWTVINLDKLTYAGNAESLADLREDAKHVFVRGDILNAELVDRLMSDRKVDVVLMNEGPEPAGNPGPEDRAGPEGRGGREAAQLVEHRPHGELPRAPARVGFVAVDQQELVHAVGGRR